MCMEGIEHNPVVYELMSEMAYRTEKVQLVVRMDLVRILIFYMHVVSTIGAYSYLFHSG